GYLRAHGLDLVTVQAAVGWATQPEPASPAWHSKRLSAVRGFASYLATIDQASEVLPRGLLPGRASRSTPYLYSPPQIQALMAAAGRLACPAAGGHVRDVHRADGRHRAANRGGDGPRPRRCGPRRGRRHHRALQAGQVPPGTAAPGHHGRARLLCRPPGPAVAATGHAGL